MDFLGRFQNLLLRSSVPGEDRRRGAAGAPLWPLAVDVPGEAELQGWEHLSPRPLLRDAEPWERAEELAAPAHAARRRLAGLRAGGHCAAAGHSVLVPTRGAAWR